VTASQKRELGFKETRLFHRCTQGQRLELRECNFGKLFAGYLAIPERLRPHKQLG